MSERISHGHHIVFSHVNCEQEEVHSQFYSFFFGIIAERSAEMLTNSSISFFGPPTPPVPDVGNIGGQV